MSDQELSITKEEVAAFSSKLERWGATLQPKERALLDVLVKLAEQGLPSACELTDEDLSSVTGGAGLPSLGQQTSSLFGRLAGTDQRYAQGLQVLISNLK